MGVALSRPWGDNHAWQNFWSIAYPLQKELWKNIHMFSCYNFLNNYGILKWTLSCHAPRRPCICELSLCVSTYYKRNYQKIFSRSQVIKTKYVFADLYCIYYINLKTHYIY